MQYTAKGQQRHERWAPLNHNSGMPALRKAVEHSLFMSQFGLFARVGIVHEPAVPLARSGCGGNPITWSRG